MKKKKTDESSFKDFGVTASNANYLKSNKL